MKTTKIISLTLIGCYLQLTVVFGDCQTYQDVWRQLIIDDDNNIEKITDFFIKCRKDEKILRILNNAITKYIINENAEEFRLKINSLNITESPKNCENITDIWNGIIENNEFNIDKLDQFQTESKKVKAHLNDLIVHVEEYLIKKNANLLLNAVNNYDLKESPKNISLLIDNILEIYRKHAIFNIFNKTVDGIYNTNSMSAIPDVIWRLYQGDLISFKIMAMAQIRTTSVYSIRSHNIESQFVYKMAYRLFRIQQEPLYKKLPYHIRYAIWNLTDTFPKNLRYLFFITYFCLRNVRNSKYIHTAIEYNTDEVNRYIWLSSNKSSLCYSRYLKADFAEIEQELKIALMATKNEIYFAMEPNTHIINGLDFSSSSPKYVWNMEFMDNDRVWLSQNDYLMCALETYNFDKQNIGALLKNEASYLNTNCQWNLGECYYPIQE